MQPSHLRWFSELQAIAQNGLTYSTNPFDIERFKRIREIAAEIAAEAGILPAEKILSLLMEEKNYATPKVDVRGIVYNEKNVSYWYKKPPINVGQSPVVGSMQMNPRARLLFGKFLKSLTLKQKL